MLRTLLLLLPVAAVLTGCAGDSTTPTTTNTDANGNQVSSVPWNRPETWETTGQLGGMNR